MNAFKMRNKINKNNNSPLNLFEKWKVFKLKKKVIKEIYNYYKENNLDNQLYIRTYFKHNSNSKLRYEKIIKHTLDQIRKDNYFITEYKIQYTNKNLTEFSFYVEMPKDEMEVILYKENQND